ncbi:MAG: oxygen-independent coproporphyrinogen III oxidase [Proteobacteria bacterium]|nr:oxygen-independent coproporphyrinogen III oxidase [Pseudomonadota bacterium]
MDAATAISDALVAKYDRPVPRYTSYPPANHFCPDVTARTYTDWLAQIPEGALGSVYVHLPFCAALCRYCGCTMQVTRKNDVMYNYLKALQAEIALACKAIGHKLPLRHLHFGGGTPTHMPDDALRTLMDSLRQAFDFADDAELAIEVDPRTMTQAKARLLAELGFNRASLGVQDTDPQVQTAIARVQPLTMVTDCVNWLREAGIIRLNFDLIYGLPHQSVATMRQTVADTLALRPDRISLFGYAHIPQVKKHQALLEAHPLPDAHARRTLFATATADLLAGGYTAIGIDHFALPEDSLAQAAKDGTLRRNFQGYTDDDCPVLLGFGASAISQLPGGYAQNVVSIKTYGETLLSGHSLPTVRGYGLSEADKAHREVIMAIMCRDTVDVPTHMLPAALPALLPLIADGLVTLTDTTLHITPRGQLFTRLVAACFDPYTQASSKPHARAI